MKIRFNKFGFAIAILLCLGAIALFFTDFGVRSSFSYTLSFYCPVKGNLLSFDNILTLILLLSPVAAIICSFASRSLAVTGLVSTGIIAVGWVAKFVNCFLASRSFEKDMFFLIGTLAAACMCAISVWQNSKTDAIIFNAIFAAAAIGYVVYFILSKQPADPIIYIILSHGLVYGALLMLATSVDIETYNMTEAPIMSEQTSQMHLSPQGVVADHSAPTLLSALSELSEKYKSGAITAEEYEQQKKNLIWRK